MSAPIKSLSRCCRIYLNVKTGASSSLRSSAFFSASACRVRTRSALTCETCVLALETVLAPRLKIFDAPPPLSLMMSEDPMTTVWSNQ